MIPTDTGWSLVPVNYDAGASTDKYTLNTNGTPIEGFGEMTFLYKVQVFSRLVAVFSCY